MPSASHFASNQSTASYKPVEEKLKSEIINGLKGRTIPVKIYINSRIIEAHISEFQNDKFILNYAAQPAPILFSRDTVCECHFSIGRDMYFFKTHLELTKGSLSFETPSIVYKVQRRENFRVYLPETVQQNIELVGERNSTVKINNLSLTGAQVVIKSADANLALDRFKLNSLIRLKISLLTFNHTINCIVKFVESSPKNGSTICGIQFQNIDAERLQELQNVISKIDRLNRQVA